MEGGKRRGNHQLFYENPDAFWYKCTGGDNQSSKPPSFIPPITCHSLFISSVILLSFSDDMRGYFFLALAELRKPLTIKRCCDELIPTVIIILIKYVKFLFMLEIMITFV
jgi:hypothetical protein